MKIHITNSYGLNNEKEMRQHLFAESGRKLGFYEMGIQVYPTETDTYSELSARLDGIIAAVEHDDLIIVQLPTGNGIDFEAILIDKLLAYSHQRVCILWHDETYRTEYRERISGYIAKEEIINFDTQYDEITCQQIMLEMVTQLQREAHPYMQADEGDAIDDGSIHIGFGLYDKYGTYSVWVGTAMESVIENTDAAVTFHILHDDTLTQDNRQKLIQVAKSGGQKIQFHHFDSSLFSGVEGMMRQFTIGTMFRLLLPDVLPKLSKIIYLDADLFVNADIKDLWNVDISDYCLAAVRDYGVVCGIDTPYPVSIGQVDAVHYFNAGVLCMNLEQIRKKGKLLELVLAYLQDNSDARYPDQDAFNVIFKENCYWLDDSWNCFASSIEGDEVINKNIIHYAGTLFVLYMQKKIDQMYFEIIERTPWGSEKCREVLNSSLGRLNDMIQQSENLLKRLKEKQRRIVFYGTKTWSVGNMMNLLQVKEQNSICLEQMTDTILENKDDYIVCMLPDAEESHGIEILEKHGWKTGLDYFVIPRILFVTEGGYL